MTFDTNQVIALAASLVHAQEILAQSKPDDRVPHHDHAALKSSLLACAPLMAQMDKLALLPVRRDGVRYLEGE